MNRRRIQFASPCERAGGRNGNSALNQIHF